MAATRRSVSAGVSLCEKSSRAIEIVHTGNGASAILTARHAMELKCPHRVILAPTHRPGPGVQPLGILRLIALISSLADIPAEIVVGFATGNTARMRPLGARPDRVGRPADFVFMARHTLRRQGSARFDRLATFPAWDGDDRWLVRCQRTATRRLRPEVPVVAA